MEYNVFSQNGLIEQLQSEGYNRAEAKFAAENINVDWKEQAAKSAFDYVLNISFSKAGLVEQLMSEGFTRAEAKYGADSININWNDIALKCAKEYTKIQKYPDLEGLKEQLEYDGFTKEQVRFAVAAINKEFLERRSLCKTRSIPLKK